MSNILAYAAICQLPSESRNFALHHAYDAYHPYHITTVYVQNAASRPQNYANGVVRAVSVIREWK
jgi:hypothetical protein